MHRIIKRQGHPFRVWWAVIVGEVRGFETILSLLELQRLLCLNIKTRAFKHRVGLDHARIGRTVRLDLGGFGRLWVDPQAVVIVLTGFEFQEFWQPIPGHAGREVR